jgi:hypothetical protein
MKKTILLVFLVIAFIGYSQEKKASDIDAELSLTDTSQLRNSAVGDFTVIQVSLSSGISSPSSSFSDNSFASAGSFFDLSSAYYFSKFGLGISIGQFSNPTEGDFTEFTNQLGYPITNSSKDWKTSYYGIGPNVNLDLGKYKVTLFARYGQMSTKEISLVGNYTIDDADVSRTIPIYNLRFPEKTSSAYYNAGVRLGYKINPNLSFHVSVNYLTTSDDLEIESRQANFEDLDGDGVITEQEILKLIGGQIDYSTTSTFSKLSALNYGFGLSYHFDESKRGKRKRREGATDNQYLHALKTSNRTGDTNPYYAQNVLLGEMVEPRNSGSIVFTNPAKEKAEKKNKQRKLVNVLPKNNSHFNTENEIKKFSWKVIGTKISNPQFILEVTKIGNNQQSQRIYIEKTSKTSLGATNIFKENKISDGQYRWKVTETTTGISSNPSFFTMTQCEIDFTISNEEIECLGYEQENRKFKICFDVTYASTSGDLTFVNPGSGLSVYDQTYAALSYTLVSPNPILVVQIGASTTTVSYCFEVTVAASVTGIGFGLQGDDLDPSPITCQPGVSSSFDELPDCICDECEEIELSFDDFNISLNGGTGNQFNFNGNINVNVPIYGIEFQVQSYSYTASPSACSDGVNSVEESGMILMPGTSINGSTTLEIPNETVSGSPSSNDNASKFVKYTSNTALTGAIPINLTIGLPGPLDGLDPSCCLIEYTVCIKVRIFYEDDNCKSCVFTHCFNFNNQ